VILTSCLTNFMGQLNAILRRKKRWRLVHLPIILSTSKTLTTLKNVQKSCVIFKPSIHNVVSTGSNIAKIRLSLCLMGCVRFVRYCGKMYSRHLFSYGGFPSCRNCNFKIVRVNQLRSWFTRAILKPQFRHDKNCIKYARQKLPL